MHLSVIIPAYNARADLKHVLGALLPQLGPGDECIVVDDRSTDDTLSIAEEIIAERANVEPPSHRGSRVLQVEVNSGPAIVRNHGARQASGDIFLFIDSDTVPHADLVERVRGHFLEDSTIAALMGSYDKNPYGQSTVSRFRNLLHAYTHHNGNPEAWTFWAGCGAIRKDTFWKVGGFDGKRFAIPSIEDIELGLRLRQSGHRILLDPTLQVQHRKIWTWNSMVRTDIFCRAVPWTLLLAEAGEMPADLNLKLSQRFSAVAVALSILLLPALFWQPLWAGLAIVVLLGYAIVANLPLYRFLAECGGWGFAIRSIPAHWTYYLSGLTGFTIATMRRIFGKSTAKAGEATTES